MCTPTRAFSRPAISSAPGIPCAFLLFYFLASVFLVKSCHHSRAPETPDSEIALSISFINHAAECASINATHYSSVAGELTARIRVSKLARRLNNQP